MAPFTAAKPIWLPTPPARDEYATFQKKFTWHGGNTILYVAAETDYIACVNGERVGFCAFAGYKNEKYYDTLDVTTACRAGENELTFTVRYEGVNSATHIDSGAFLLFEVREDEKTVAVSDETTLGALDTGYLQHVARPITGQLGLSSGMRARTPVTLGPCREMAVDCTFLPRPVKPIRLLPEVSAGELPIAGHRIFDLGRETAGYLHLRVRVRDTCLLRVTYGEHLTDGAVRSRIGNRNFSLDFACEPGENDFLQLFVRLAGRYLELLGGEEAEVLSVGLLPAEYPVTEKGTPDCLSGLDRRIYETCVRTLRLCMHTHYEDCPWREQALYVLDARNQMLCGYDAFRESDFARANLVFIAKGTRPDGFLELTYPAVNTPAIPFFSVMYPVAVYEYVERTGDETILPEVMPTMSGIMRALGGQMRPSGLIENLPPPFWNFYEWSTGSDGAGELGSNVPRPPKCDLILNCAYVFAAERFESLCRRAGTPCQTQVDTVREAILSTFYDAATGLFRSSTREPRYTVLGNAFALLVGLGDERTVAALRGNGSLVPATLSMLGYVFDARLLHGERPDEILADIRAIYGRMLNAGATSFWETVAGEADFGGAGSLCHGWSAMPIHYYHRLLCDSREKSAENS